MGISAVSVLIYNNEPVGVRSVKRVPGNTEYFDVELDSLKRFLRPEHIKILSRHMLIEKGDMLVTEEELRDNIHVGDKSDDVTYCRFVAEDIKLSYAKYLENQQNNSKPANVTQGGTSGNSPTQPMFNVVVEALAGYPEKLTQMRGQFRAKNALMARKEAKEFYASELGAELDDIKVIDCVLAN